MRPESHRLVPLVTSLTIVCFGCGSVGPPPADAGCDGTAASASSSEGLVEALATAAAGDCVVVGDGPFVGSFEVPAGVKLLAGEGNDGLFEGDDPERPAIQLLGGADSALWNVHVTGALGDGVVVVGGPALISGVTVEGAAETALLIVCAGVDCLDEARTITVRDAELHTSRLGLWAAGARVDVVGGTMASHSSTGIVGGYGMVASEGALLTANGSKVTDNEDVGVLLDGAIVATLTDLDASDNFGRGIWAQGLRGSIASPALTIDGGATTVRANHIVGLGSHDSKGIIVVTGNFEATIPLKISTSIDQNAMIGDGIGLFAASGDIRIEDPVGVRDNGRAQLLVDNGSTSIIVVTGNVGGGAHPVVVQNTVETVQVDVATIDASAPELGVETKSFDLPPPAP